MTEGGLGASFSRLGVAATPEQAAVLRNDLSQWLQRCFAFDAESTNDVLLAVNEALANAAEFAYLGISHGGVMHLRADYLPPTTLTVTVSDEGRWHTRDPAVARDIARGRGLRLMRALTDHTAVDSTPAGTEVRLRWDHVNVVSGTDLRSSEA